LYDKETAAKSLWLDNEKKQGKSAEPEAGEFNKSQRNKICFQIRKKSTCYRYISQLINCFFFKLQESQQKLHKVYKTEAKSFYYVKYGSSIITSENLSQCPRTDSNKRFLPWPKTITAWKLIPHRSNMSKN
jgi:hypothetical protein